MNTTVDTRVVELQFDNAQFERNVQDSLKTLDELNESLDMEGAAKGAKNLQNAFSGSNANSVTTSLSRVESSFSALEIAGIRVIQNLTDTVVNFGKNIISKYIIGPISQGFSKYGEKNTAMRTTLNAVKERYDTEEEAVEAVTESVEKLMWFSDETSYSFNEMLSNISKFTAAGGDLGKSTDVMIGISNAAALAGQNSASAARAMYNLAQAYGTGSVKLIDWKSVENANIATSKLKQTIIDSAVELGKLKKQGDKVFAGKNEVTTGTFNSTLATGWFDKEVMEKAFGEYANFTNALFEESQKTGLTATELLNTIEDVKKGSADAKEIETVSSMIKNLGIEATDTKSELDILTESIGSISFKAAQEARTFGDAMSAIMDVITTGWMDVSEKVFGNVDESAKIWTTFANEVSSALWEVPGRLAEILSKWRELEGHTALFNAIGNVWESFKSIISAISDAFRETFGTLDDAGVTLAKVTKVFESFTEKLKPSATVLNVIKTSVKALLSVLKIASYVVPTVTKLFPVIISQLLYWFKSLEFVFSNTFKTVVQFIDKLAIKLKEIAPDILKRVIEYFKQAADAIGKFISKVPGLIVKGFNSIKSFITSSYNIAATYFSKFKGLIVKLPDILSQLWSTSSKFMRDSIATLISKIPSIFSGFKDSLIGGVSKVRSAWASLVVSIKKIFVGLVNTIKKAFSTVKTFVFELPNKISSAWRSALSSVKNAVMAFKDKVIVIFNKIKSSLSYAVSNIKDVWHSGLESIKKLLNSVGNFAKKIFRSVKDSLSTTSIADVWSKVIEKIKSAFVSFKEAILNSFGKVKNFLTDIALKVKTVWTNVVSKLRELFVKLDSKFNITNTWTKAFNSVKKVLSSIYEKAVSVFEKIKAALSGIPEKISIAWHKAIDFIKNYIANFRTNISSTFSSIKSFSITAAEKVKSAWTIAIEKIKSGFTSVLNVVKPIAEKIKNVFVSVASKLKTVFQVIGSKIKEVFSSFGTFTFGGFDSSGSFKFGIFDRIKSIIARVSDFSKTVLRELIPVKQVIGIAGEIIGSIRGDSKTLGEATTGAMDSLSNTLDSVSKFLKAKTRSVKSNNFLKISLGIAAICFGLMKAIEAIKELSAMDTADIIKGTAAIAAILAAIGGLLLIFNSASAKTEKASVGSSILMLTGIMAIASATKNVASALKELKDMSFDDIKNSVIGLGAVLAVMGGVLIATSKFAKFKAGVTFNPVAFTSLATALTTIAPTFISLGKLSLEEITLGSLAMISILGSMTAVIAIASKTIDGVKGSFVVPSSFSAIASAVQQVAPSFIEFSNLTPAQIVQGSLAMATILAEMSAVLIITSKFIDITDFSSILAVTSGFTSIGNSLATVAPVFVNLSELSPAAILKGTIAMTLILAEMAAVFVICSKFSSFSIGAFAIGPAFKGIAESVEIIAPSFATLGEMPIASIIKGSAVLTYILTAMSGVMLLLGNFTGVIGSIVIFGVAASFKSMASAIVSLTDSLVKLSQIDGSNINRGAVLAIDAIVDIMRELMGGLELPRPKKIDAFSGAIVNVSTAISDIAPAFKSLSSLKDSDITSGSNALTVILNALSKAINSAGNLGSIFSNRTVKNSEAYSNVAKAIVDIVDPFKKLSSLKPDVIERGNSVISSILVNMANTLTKLHNVTLVKGTSYDDIGSGLASTAEAVASVADPFSKLGKMSPTQLEKASDAMDVILDGMAYAINSVAKKSTSSFGTDISSAGKAYKDTAEAVKDIVDPFKKLSGITAAKAEVASNTLNAILSGISSSLTTTLEGTETGWFSKRASLAEIGGAYKSLAEAVETIASPFKTLAGLNESRAETGAATLKAILEGISNSLGITLEDSESGWFSKKESIVSIGGAYKDVASAVETIANPFKTLSGLTASQAKLGSDALNAILKGISSSLTGTKELSGTGWFESKETYVSIGAAYQSVALAVKDIQEPFSKLSKLTTEEVSNGSSALNELLKGMSNSLTDTKNASSTGWFENKETFSSIGSAYQSVASAVKDIVEPFKSLAKLDEEDAKNGSAALNAILSGMSASLVTSFEGTTSKWYEKTQDVNQLGSAYESLARAVQTIVGPFETLAGLGGEKAQNGASALNAILNGIAESLGKASDETETPFWMVSQNVTDIGTAFTTIADAMTKVIDPVERLSKLSESVDGKESSIDKGIAAYKSIADGMAEALGTGSNWDALWGNGVSDVGKGFYDFASSMQIVTDLFKDGGTFNEVKDNVKAANLEGFATDLTALYTPLSQLTSLGAMDGNGLSAINTFATAFNDIATTISSIGSGAEDMSAATAITSLKDSFVELMNLFAVDSITGEQDERISKVTEALNQFSAIKGSKSFTSFVNDIGRLEDSLTNIANPDSGVDIGANLNSVAEALSGISTAGSTITEELSTGIGDTIWKVTDKVAWMMRKAVARVGDFYSQFVTQGKNIDNGLVEGINANSGRVVDAIRRVCQEAANAGKEELDINSPSKVFASIGRSIDEGLSKGIDEDGIDVKNSVKSICDMAIAAADILANDYDGGFTITPVIDMSNVEEGSKKISAMLSRKQALAVSSANTARKISQEAISGKQIQTETVEPSASTYSFVQNNYSPKSLSQSDIYRQTKNQFSMLKGLIKV